VRNHIQREEVCMHLVDSPHYAHRKNIRSSLTNGTCLTFTAAIRFLAPLTLSLLPMCILHIMHIGSRDSVKGAKNLIAAVNVKQVPFVNEDLILSLLQVLVIQLLLSLTLSSESLLRNKSRRTRSYSLDGFVIEVRGSGFVYSALYEVDVSLVVSSQGHVH
jgi:hypothetical protein